MGVPPGGGLINTFKCGKSSALYNRLQQELELCAIRNTSWYDSLKEAS